MHTSIMWICDGKALQICKRLGVSPRSCFSDLTKNPGLGPPPARSLDTSRFLRMTCRTISRLLNRDTYKASSTPIRDGRGRGYDHGMGPIFVSLTSHYWHLRKRLYRFGQREREALSAPTQRNTLRDQNPKGQLWLWAVLCCAVPSLYTTLKPSDTCESK